VRILGISGSLDGASSNTALLRAVRSAAPAGHEVHVHRSLEDVPPCSPDRDREPPAPAVASLRASVQAADAVVIATPEYAGGMPGTLKNALDWLVGSGELYGKPVVVVSAAPSAERGHNARESLERTLRMQGAEVCGSFSVAVPRGLRGDDLAASATAVLERVLVALRGAPCGTPTPAA
jgi:chromate reductase